MVVNNCYMIDIPDDYPECVMLRYDHARNPRSSELDKHFDNIDGLHFLPAGASMLKRIKKLDMIDSDHGTYTVLRVNIVDVLVAEAGCDVKVQRIFVGGDLWADFQVVIVPYVADCVDYSRSKFSWVKYGDLEKVRIDDFVFRCDSLGGRKIVRCAVVEKDGWLPGPEVLVESLGEEIVAMKPRGLVLSKCNCFDDGKTGERLRQEYLAAAKLPGSGVF